MQELKQELFMLNWEVSDLSRKLKKFADVFSTIDFTTVDCLDLLLDAIDSILTKASIERCFDWDSTDKKIFKGYAFHHSINCKQCGRAVKTTRPSLLKHLKEHAITKESIMVNEEYDLELVSALNGIKLNVQDNASQSDATTIINDAQKAENNATYKSRIKKKGNIVNETTENVLGTNDKTKIKSKSQTDVVEASNQNSSTKLDKLQNDGNVSKPNSPAVGERRTELVRNTHVPNRTKGGEYIVKGSIPNTRVELSKRILKFIAVAPKTRLTEIVLLRKAVTESPIHRDIEESLEKTFKKHLPMTKVYLFGSRITGLGSESSDLDIYLDLQENYDGSYGYSNNKIRYLIQLAYSILEDSQEWSKLEAVTAARTPILRAWNIKHRIDCDISFTHGLSHSNTRMIQYMFKLQPVCYYVALYVKEWSHNFSMLGLNTYTIVLLTIFYLQKQNLLPSIYSLQKATNKPYFVSYWQANFELKSLEQLEIPEIPENEAENHIIKFFSYYGSQFCFDTLVVCPYLGWAPLKEDFDPIDKDFPVEMDTLQKYYSQLDMTTVNPTKDLLSYKKPMVVQDPLELNHNVAKGICPTDVNRFRHYCQKTATVLDEMSKKMSLIQS